MSSVQVLPVRKASCSNGDVGPPFRRQRDTCAFDANRSSNAGFGEIEAERPEAGTAPKRKTHTNDTFELFWKIAPS